MTMGFIFNSIIYGDMYDSGIMFGSAPVKNRGNLKICNYLHSFHVK